jgi:hypothetical protein
MMKWYAELPDQQGSADSAMGTAKPTTGVKG